VSQAATLGTDEAQQLISSARALRPLLEEHAAESEQQRKLAEPVIEAIRGAGIFELMVPRKHGGLELDLDTFLEVGLALGEGDASAAWVTTFLVEHNWMFCQFPAGLQEELYRDRSHVLAPGMVAPTGQAARAATG
jgi:alkylation response protein AidB-like acyl-CoA dehydrogenase